MLMLLLLLMMMLLTAMTTPPLVRFMMVPYSRGECTMRVLY